MSSETSNKIVRQTMCRVRVKLALDEASPTLSLGDTLKLIAAKLSADDWGQLQTLIGDAETGDDVEAIINNTTATEATSDPRDLAHDAHMSDSQLKRVELELRKRRASSRAAAEANMLRRFPDIALIKHGC